MKLASVSLPATLRTFGASAFSGAPLAKTVSVYGVVEDGVGYGTAVVRGKGAVSVMVE